MSTPARENAKGRSRKETLARLAAQLDEALAGVDIASVEVGDVERQGRRLTIPVTVEAAADAPDEDTETAAEKSWSEEDPEGFEEAVEYLLEKNRELYQRLS